MSDLPDPETPIVFSPEITQAIDAYFALADAFEKAYAASHVSYAMPLRQAEQQALLESVDLSLRMVVDHGALLEAGVPVGYLREREIARYNLRANGSRRDDRITRIAAIDFDAE